MTNASNNDAPTTTTDDEIDLSDIDFSGIGNVSSSEPEPEKFTASTNATRKRSNDPLGDMMKDVARKEAEAASATEGARAPKSTSGSGPKVTPPETAQESSIRETVATNTHTEPMPEKAPESTSGADANTSSTKATKPPRRKRSVSKARKGEPPKSTSGSESKPKPEQQDAAAPKSTSDPVHEIIAVSDIDNTGLLQDRDDVDNGALTANVKAVGRIEVAVRLARNILSLWPNGKAPTDKLYVTVDGHCRIDAAAEAGLTHVPAIVSDMTHPEAVEHAFLANDHRQEHTATAKARSIARYRAATGKTTAEVGAEFGLGEKQIQNYGRLDEMPEQVRGRVADKSSRVSFGHAIELDKGGEKSEAATGKQWTAKKWAKWLKLVDDDQLSVKALKKAIADDLREATTTKAQRKAADTRKVVQKALYGLPKLAEGYSTRAKIRSALTALSDDDRDALRKQFDTAASTAALWLEVLGAESGDKANTEETA